LVLTARIKQNGRIYKNGSRQVIAAIEGGEIRFQSGLLLRQDDGRVRQGDAVTTYKAQGSSRLQMVRVEDNCSLRAMASREDLHVAFTRHRATATMFVENIDVLKEVANRSSSSRLNASDLASIDRTEKENRTILATNLPTVQPTILPLRLECQRGVTAIVIDMSCQEHIRHYQTDSVNQAHDFLIQEWVDGGVIWNSWEFAGPNCTAEVPAFSPEYLRSNCFNEEPRDVILNVTVFEWWCCTGRPDSDDHLVYGYFVLDE
jgi:hypothetical protein